MIRYYARSECKDNGTHICKIDDYTRWAPKLKANVSDTVSRMAGSMFLVCRYQNLFCVFLRRGLHFPKVLWTDSLRYFSERGGRRGYCLHGKVAV